MEKRVFEYVSLKELPKKYQQIAKGAPHNGLYCGCDYSPWMFVIFAGLFLVPLGFIGFSTLLDVFDILTDPKKKITIFNTHISGIVSILFIASFIYWIISSFFRFRHKNRRQLGCTHDGLYVLQDALFFHYSKNNNWLIPAGRLDDVQNAITYRSENAGRPSYSMLLAYYDNENELVRFPFDEADKLASDIPALLNVLKLWCTDPEKAIKLSQAGKIKKLPSVETVNCC